MKKQRKVPAKLFLGMALVAILTCLLSACQSEEEKIYAIFRREIGKDKNIPEELKAEICMMTLSDFILKNPLKRETLRLETESAVLQASGDGIWKALEQRKEAKLQPVREKYRDKTRILRIKRIWLNGETLPWTYESWMMVSYSFRGSYHGSRYGGSVSGSITPNIHGGADYTGDNKLDYINVVFSDNSYKRFLIKDNPEWLLARVGETVKVTYTVNDYHVGTDVGRVLHIEPFDLLVNFSYTPLFK